MNIRRETLSGDLHFANFREMPSGRACPGPENSGVGRAGKKGRLSGGPIIFLGLQTVQEVGGALGMGGGGEDRALVVLQHLEP